MREVDGDIWALHAKGKPVVVTTNGITKANGHAVMGRGVALAAARKFPELPAWLGRELTLHGNHVYYFPQFRLFTFPTKYHWRDPSDMQLIARSCDELRTVVDRWSLVRADADMEEIFLVRPGCASGGLNWDDVKPVIAPLLDDRFVVVHKE